MIPGEILYAEEPVAYNEGREPTTVTVLNTADRPVQVGSHYHFAEANPGLDFDRAAAYGKRLHIPAGTAVRFEPGIPAEVALVPLAGARVVAGLRGETAGPLDTEATRADTRTATRADTRTATGAPEPRTAAAPEPRTAAPRAGSTTAAPDEGASRDDT